MKRTLSFLKPVYGGLSWVRRGCLIFWRVGRFEYFPTERNLLLSFWYGFVHYKVIKKGATVLDYLDGRVIFMKRELENNDLSSKKKQMYRDLLSAVFDPRIRTSIIEFLESPDPEKHCQPLIDTIKTAWRMGEEVKAPSIEGMSGLPALPAAEAETAKKEVALTQEKAALDAKTYVVATEIHFELFGKPEQYLKIAKHSRQLEEFVRRQFRVSQLPGSFRKLREYSYKKVLEETNNHKLGQLRRPLNQIIEHPEVFGTPIVIRARQILEDNII
jgi:hypothetical protein